MNPFKLLNHMDHLVEHYNVDKANAVHKQFGAVEDTGDEISGIGIIKKTKAVVDVCYCCHVLLIVYSK